jgi:sulfate transport system permease protein
VQPILEDLESELEEAASSLGANRIQIFLKVLFPILLPRITTGFALAFAEWRWANMDLWFLLLATFPMVSEITPLIIITKLEQYDYAGATAI